MTLKNIRRKIWNGLPVVSLFRYCNKYVSGEYDSLGKCFGHSVYSMLPFVYLVTSLLAGTPNISRWNEIREQSQREKQEYNSLYNKVVECVDRDGIEGLTSLAEIDELYSKAGIDVRDIDFDPRRGLTINRSLPNIKGNDLKKVVASCESEE